MCGGNWGLGLCRFDDGMGCGYMMLDGVTLGMWTLDGLDVLRGCCENSCRRYAMV